MVKEKRTDTPGTPSEFEEALADLKELVDQMEHGDLSLQQSIEAFEQGTDCAQRAQKILISAEQSVQILQEGATAHTLDASGAENDNHQ